MIRAINFLVENAKLVYLTELNTSRFYALHKLWSVKFFSEFAESSEEEEDSSSEKEFLLEEVSENDEEEVETKDSNTDIEVITNKEKTLKSEVTFIRSASSSKMAKKYREFIEIPINSSTAKKEGFFSTESNKYLKVSFKKLLMIKFKMFVLWNTIFD